MFKDKAKPRCDHSLDDLIYALGMTKKREEELLKGVEAVLQKVTRNSQVLEEVSKLSKDPIELVFLGQVVSRRQVASRMLKVLFG